MLRAMEQISQARVELAGDGPLDFDTADRLQDRLGIPVDRAELVEVSDQAVICLLDEMLVGNIDPDRRALLAAGWRHGACTGLVAAPRRYENAAKSSGNWRRLCRAAMPLRGRIAALQGAYGAALSRAVQALARDDWDKGLIGRRIIVARRLADDLSQRQLAIRIGIDRRELSRWENGNNEPSLRNLCRIAVAVGQPLEFFLSEGPDE